MVKRDVGRYIGRRTRSKRGWKKVWLSIRRITSFRQNCAPWWTSSSTLNSNPSSFAPLMASMWYASMLSQCVFHLIIIHFSSLSAPVPHQNRWADREDFILHVSRYATIIEMEHYSLVSIADLYLRSDLFNSPFAGVVARLLSVLESVISKLARYDEGSILGSILSFTVWDPFHLLSSSSCLSLFSATICYLLLFSIFLSVYTSSSSYTLSTGWVIVMTMIYACSKVFFHDPHSFSLSLIFSSLFSPALFHNLSLFFPSFSFSLWTWRNLWQYKQNVSGSGRDLGQAYVNFTRNSMDQIRSKVNDELWILNLFDVRGRNHNSSLIHSTGPILNLFFLSGLVFRADQNVGCVAGRPDESLSAPLPVHLLSPHRQGTQLCNPRSTFNVICSFPVCIILHEPPCSTCKCRNCPPIWRCTECCPPHCMAAMLW